MSTANCYKTEVCKESYCIDRDSPCYKTEECNYDYCIEKPAVSGDRKAQEETGTCSLLSYIIVS